MSSVMARTTDPSAERDEPPHPPDPSDPVLRHAAALGDQTRSRILTLLLHAPGALDIDALTAATGVHHNSVRRHLARLVEAGLALEAPEARSRPGRPRLTYTASPEAVDRWGSAGPYERLAVMLTEMIRSGDTATDVGRRAARRERLRAGPTDAPLNRLVELMANHGFEPSVTRHGDDVILTLHRCPFERAALADPDTICQLHLGMAHGIAESGDGLVVDELRPRDPRQAGCVLHCHVTDPHER